MGAWSTHDRNLLVLILIFLLALVSLLALLLDHCLLVLSLRLRNLLIHLLLGVVLGSHRPSRDRLA